MFACFREVYIVKAFHLTICLGFHHIVEFEGFRRCALVSGAENIYGSHICLLSCCKDTAFWHYSAPCYKIWLRN